MVNTCHRSLRIAHSTLSFYSDSASQTRKPFRGESLHTRTDARGLCFRQLSERSYRVVDSKEGSVFVQVSHGSRDREFANVYMSGSEGRAYTLSLRTVVKDYRGLSDFERINGVRVCVH